MGHDQNYCHILPRDLTKLQGFLNFCSQTASVLAYIHHLYSHFFWGNCVPNLFSNPFEALGESADENMVKEISVLSCNVSSKVLDRKQTEEENILFGYLKNESCFPAIEEGPRGTFWVSKQRRCFSKQPQNSCIPLSEQDLEVFLEWEFSSSSSVLGRTVLIFFSPFVQDGNRLLSFTFFFF